MRSWPRSRPSSTGSRDVRPIEMTDERESGLHIDVTISVGYRRLRSNTIDRWEARVGTLGLLVVGAVVVVILLVLVLPRVLDVFGRG
jgi:hypothetical protein